MKLALTVVLMCSFGCLSATEIEMVGTPPDIGIGNCFPFGCSYTGTYQQLYQASAFSRPITITGLQFFNTAWDTGASLLSGGTFVVTLSATSVNWNTLSANYQTNVGPSPVTVFSGAIAPRAWAFGDTLVIPFAVPYTYDPATGNLLMSVSGSNVAQASVYFDTNGYNNGTKDGNTYLARVYRDGSGLYIVNSGYGLVTGFVGSDVPEPVPSMLLAAGLMAGLLLRRRSSVERPMPACAATQAGATRSPSWLGNTGARFRATSASE